MFGKHLKCINFVVLIKLKNYGNENLQNRKGIF